MIFCLRRSRCRRDIRTRSPTRFPTRSLDAILEQDPTARVAAETLVSTGLVVMTGEITTAGKHDYAKIARETIRKIGYNDPELRFDADGCAVMVCYGRQSPDIKRGVDQASDDHLNQGAGDQGLMFGYACDETPDADAVPDLLRASARPAPERSAGRTAACRGCAPTPSRSSPSATSTASPSRSTPSCSRRSTIRA